MGDKDYCTINDRIEELVNERFSGNKIAFAKAIGLSNPTSISSYLGKQRRSKPSIDMFKNIVVKLHVDPMWLLTGQEPISEPTCITATDFSAASGSGDASVFVGDPVLSERIRSLETLLAEKNVRLAEKDELLAVLKERISELKSHSGDT